MKTLVLGLGNVIRRDDGVGNRVAQVLQTRIKSPDITVMDIESGGVRLLDYLPGYDRLIIIDAMKSQGGKAGQIYRLTLENLIAPDNPMETHLIGINTIMELGNRLGMNMPKQVIIYGIEAADLLTFGEGLSPEVEKAIPEAVRLVLNELGESH